ncbi:hypothetical protein K490DRAFT_61169 [Saccharata proteae CBS 121410]|uniref:Uncharacterized protein n=1 Tax=Saccharata proteae CBS 121410 TaxID=1314787 RepID=A0A9P4I4N5_9PEZI|nr:hypothetical protein K490DRAFT_61169 [Saccharata proteae CBS 121410]
MLSWLSLKKRAYHIWLTLPVLAYSNAVHNLASQEYQSSLLPHPLLVAATVTLVPINQARAPADNRRYELILPLSLYGLVPFVVTENVGAKLLLLPVFYVVLFGYAEVHYLTATTQDKPEIQDQMTERTNDLFNSHYATLTSPRTPTNNPTHTAPTTGIPEPQTQPTLSSSLSSEALSAMPPIQPPSSPTPQPPTRKSPDLSTTLHQVAAHWASTAEIIDLTQHLYSALLAEQARSSGLAYQVKKRQRDVDRMCHINTRLRAANEGLAARLERAGLTYSDKVRCRRCEDGEAASREKRQGSTSSCALVAGEKVDDGVDVVSSFSDDSSVGGDTGTQRVRRFLGKCGRANLKRKVGEVLGRKRSRGFVLLGFRKC